MLLSRFIAGVSSIVLLALGSSAVFGQAYPNKPIRIVTAPAGGGSDFMARQISQGISIPLGEPVIIENRGGVATAETLAKARNDGYTLSLNGANVWITPLLQKTSYDVVRDFSPVTLISREVGILAVNPSLPVKSVRELIDLAKAKPGELNYSSGSIGGVAFLGVELFKSMAGIKVVNVLYKGNPPAIAAVVSNEVQMTINDPGLVAPLVKSGKLRPLAVTSAEPSPLAPGLPTVASSGVPGYEWTAMSGIFVPARTPDAIINRLNQEIVRFLSRADVKERFLSAGFEVVASTPAEYAAVIRSEIAKTSKVIKDAGISVDLR